MNRLTFTVTEAAEILGVSRALMYAQIKNGEIRATRVGRRVIVTKPTLEELLGHPIEVAAP